MSGGLKRALALFLCLCALIPAAYAEGTEDLLSEFVLHHGDRNVNKIAITVDDCYQMRDRYPFHPPYQAGQPGLLDDHFLAGAGPAGAG